MYSFGDFLSSFCKSCLFFESYHMFSILESQAVISTEQNQYHEHSIEFENLDSW